MRELNIRISDVNIEITPPKIIGSIIGGFVWIIFGYISGMIWSDYVFSDFGLTQWSNIWVYFWLLLWPVGWFWRLILPFIIIVVILLVGLLVWDNYEITARIRNWNIARMCRNVLRRNKQ